VTGANAATPMTTTQLAAPESPFGRRFFFLAKRFVAGEAARAAMDAIETLNAHGLTATLDFLGEDVLSHDDAERTRDEYFTLLDAIRVRGVQSNVSLKLTAMGLLVNEDFAVENVSAVVAHAAGNSDPFVRIDMEGSALLERTLTLFETIWHQRKNVGPVLQAYLYRTPSDIADMVERGARVRLCKGAYKEPADVAVHGKETVQSHFMTCAVMLLRGGVYPGIATHDPEAIAAIRAILPNLGRTQAEFEFQMLYGVRPELQRALVDAGYNVRIYVPFGSAWAKYLRRRVMERRENAVFAIRSLMGG
jgi:proline dehydrogenase